MTTAAVPDTGSDSDSDSDSDHDLPTEFVVDFVDDHRRRPPGQMPRPPALPLQPDLLQAPHGGDRRRLSCIFIIRLVHLALLIAFVAGTLVMTAQLPKQFTGGNAAGRARIACPVAIAVLGVSQFVVFALFDDRAYGDEELR